MQPSEREPASDQAGGSDTDNRLTRTGPRTVAHGFAEFSDKLTPRYAQPESAAVMLQKIESCLEQNFGLIFLAPYGSRGHGTHVAGYSAVDSFAVVPKSRLLEDSGAALAQIREELAKAIPEAFVTDGRPVVAVPFGERRSQRHHVVPAFQAGEKDGHDVFGIPAPRGRWIEICPGGHSVWINEIDDSLNKNLRPFIRVIKAWSYFNGDVIWPYYLELCAADFLLKDASIVYAHDLSKFFSYMVARNLAPFNDTAGCVEPVYGTSIPGKERAMIMLRSADQMAKRARECEKRDNTVDAYYWWRKIFNWRFCAY